MRGYPKVADLPYGWALLMDPTDGSPLIRVSGRKSGTCYRPHELKHSPSWPRLRDALNEISMAIDEACRRDGVPLLANKRRIAALNASIVAGVKQKESIAIQL